MQLEPNFEERFFVCNRKGYESSGKRVGHLTKEVEEIKKKEEGDDRKDAIEEKKN